jgi:glucan phosphoethanolaminetransferase (alkaline phosphatase superfamily)
MLVDGTLKRGGTRLRSTIPSVRRAFSIGAAVLSLLVPTAAQLDPPNIILVTVDTLRADRVGAYGYRSARTPVLDRLAAEGVRFDDATAHAPAFG